MQKATASADWRSWDRRRLPAGRRVLHARFLHIVVQREETLKVHHLLGWTRAQLVEGQSMIGGSEGGRRSEGARQSWKAGGEARSHGKQSMNERVLNKEKMSRSKAVGQLSGEPYLKGREPKPDAGFPVNNFTSIKLRPEFSF
jgi:hypothetical protein